MKDDENCKIVIKWCTEMLSLMKIRIFCKLSWMNIYIYSQFLYFFIDKSHREMRMQPWGIQREGFNVLLATLWLVDLLMALAAFSLVSLDGIYLWIVARLILKRINRLMEKWLSYCIRYKWGHCLLLIIIHLMSPYVCKWVYTPNFIYICI